MLDEKVTDEVLRPNCEEVESVDLLLREGVEDDEVVKSPSGSEELDPT